MGHEKRMTQGEVQLRLEEIGSWTAAQRYLQGLLLVGSYARGEARPDSDLDLVLIANNPQRWIDDQSWVELFGETKRRRVEDWGRVQSLRVWYEGGGEIEFGLTSPGWACAPLDEGTLMVIRSGFRVLIEKGGIFQPLREASPGSEVA